METEVKWSIKEKWKKEQLLLKKQQILENDFPWSLDGSNGTPLTYVGGVDISFVRNNIKDACACLVILSWPDLTVVHQILKMIELKLPYIPHFLAFREVSFFVELIEILKQTKPEFLPQIILVDGNGFLHPRGFGLACHLGVLTGIPTIGIGKTLLYVDGLNEENVNYNFYHFCQYAGDHFYLIGNSGTCWGIAYKTTDDSDTPIFISIGHKIDLKTALEITRHCCLYSLPEPVRLADGLSRRYIKFNYVPQKRYQPRFTGIQESKYPQKNIPSVISDSNPKRTYQPGYTGIMEPKYPQKNIPSVISDSNPKRIYQPGFTGIMEPKYPQKVNFPGTPGTPQSKPEKPPEKTLPSIIPDSNPKRTPQILKQPEKIIIPIKQENRSQEMNPPIQILKRPIESEHREQKYVRKKEDLAPSHSPWQRTEDTLKLFQNPANPKNSTYTKFPN